MTKFDDLLAGQQVRKHRKRPSHLEDKLQMACVRWFELQYNQYAIYLHHSPNGGYRTPAEASIFKSMGTRAGFPDLLLFLPNQYYCFMGIELKVGNNKQSPAQLQMQQAFESVGAKYVVVRSLDEFMDVVDTYMRMR